MATSSDWAVEANGLVKIFGDNRAVDGVDLRVRTGTVYGVLGPNGAGKTTTIRMLATLLRPDGGSATHLRPRRAARGADRAPAHRRDRPVRLGRRDALAPPRTSALLPPARAQTRRIAAQGHRAARGVRADGCRQAPAQELLRRHAPPPRPRREPDLAAAADLPRRADHGPRPAHPLADVGHHPPTGGARDRPCCSPPSTSTRPTSWPTASPSSTAARVVAEGTADELKASVGESSLQLRLADPADLDDVRVGASSACSASTRRVSPRPAASPPR